MQDFYIHQMVDIKVRGVKERFSSMNKQIIAFTALWMQLDTKKIQKPHEVSICKILLIWLPVT